MDTTECIRCGGISIEQFDENVGFIHDCQCCGEYKELQNGKDPIYHNGYGVLKLVNYRGQLIKKEAFHEPLTDDTIEIILRDIKDREMRGELMKSQSYFTVVSANGPFEIECMYGDKPLSYQEEENLEWQYEMAQLSGTEEEYERDLPF